MTQSSELARRIARLRPALFAIVILVFAGCDSTGSLDPDSSTPGTESPTLASASFAGGIPFGTFAQPLSEFGSRYNGAHENIAPPRMMQELAEIKSRGGKVTLMFAGNERYYKDDGNFSLAKWKARVDRYRGVNFESYINDGTIIAHYLIDEPNDPANWGGKPVSPAMLEEMAAYSKQRWPQMPTVVRTEPKYLADWSGTYRHLDAAWAQYLSRRGDAGNYVRSAIAAADRKGLALIVGLNVLKGGTPNGTQMSASEIESFGSALLSSSYPCAFISWQYNSSYLSSSSVKSAMDALRRKAQNRGSKACRGS
jgi:hypothetical protein